MRMISAIALSLILSVTAFAGPRVAPKQHHQQRQATPVVRTLPSYTSPYVLQMRAYSYQSQQMQLQYLLWQQQMQYQFMLQQQYQQRQNPYFGY